MKKLFLSLAVVAMGMLATSCDTKKNEPAPNGGNAQEKMQEVSIDATNYAKWVYFSLEQGKIVDVADPMASQDWDLGFHFTDIRTNSGDSGKGMGGAFATDLKEVTDAMKAMPSAADFVVDKTTDIITQTHNEKGEHEIKKGPGGANPVLTTFQKPKVGADGKIIRDANNLPVFEKGMLGAIDFSHGMGGARFKLSEKVYLIRTAKGKFAKIKVVDYRDAHAKSVHVKMQYTLAK